MLNEIDLVIKQGLIIDGTGNPYHIGDIGIDKGKIVRIERDLGKANAKTVISAQGMVVSPGFIDSHSHDDIYVLVNPECREKVLQGVTTVVVGNCGLSAAPLPEKKDSDIKRLLGIIGAPFVPEDFWTIRSMDDFLKKLQSIKPGINVVSLVGHNTLRVVSMGMQDRTPNSSELARMKELTSESMQQGAFGLSTGLILVPGNYAQTEEIIELGKIVAQYQGLYVTHLRSEGNTEIEAIDEALRIAREAGVPVHISHHKVAGRKNWGNSIRTLKMFHEARSIGLEVTSDQYPYTAASIYLAAVLPPSIQSEGRDILIEKLRDPAFRKEAMEEIVRPDCRGWENLIDACGFEGIVIVNAERHPQYIGKSLAQIAQIDSKGAFDTLFDLLIGEEREIAVVLHMMDEEDVKRIIQDPLTMIGTDGIPSFGHGKFHPRMTGTFPRVLGRYVREQCLLTLEEAIRKMSSLPAQTFGIKNKGLLKEGYDADIVIFNAKTIIDRGSFDDPNLGPEGIAWVLVNGQVAVENGRFVGTTSGRVLRHLQ